jgi:autotransporter-associated beta strand protein
MRTAYLDRTCTRQLPLISLALQNSPYNTDSVGSLSFGPGITAATFGGLTKLGAGILVLDQANTHTGTTTISAGELDLSRIGGSALDVADHVANDATLRVATSLQEAGVIDGVGATIVADSASLTAGSIVQNTLSIGAGGTVTIRETTGGSAVPEPDTWALLIAGAACCLPLVRRLRRAK